MTGTEASDNLDLKATARAQFWAHVDHAADRAGLHLQTLGQDVLAAMNCGLYAAVAEALRKVADESDTIHAGAEIGEFLPTAETWMRHRADQIHATDAGPDQPNPLSSCPPAYWPGV